MSSDVEKWLNGEVDNFPSRASGEDLYLHIEQIAKRALLESRSEFIAVVNKWLELRSEPKTMLAVELARKYKLSELSAELELLLKEVEQGKAFKPFYDRPIKKAIASI
jgi:hypothetical protein